MGAGQSTPPQPAHADRHHLDTGVCPPVARQSGGRLSGGRPTQGSETVLSAAKSRITGSKLIAKPQETGKIQGGV